jgi:acyl carrier protein
VNAPLPFQNWRVYQMIAAEAPVCPIGGIEPDALLTQLGFDDLRLIALCVDIEDIFRIRLSTEALREVRTASDLVRIAADAAHPIPQKESNR